MEENIVFYRLQSKIKNEERQHIYTQVVKLLLTNSSFLITPENKTI